MSGLIKIERQFSLGGKTILFFDSPIPNKKFTKLQIDGKEYKPDIVYDLRTGLGVATEGEFEGKEVKFI